MKAPAFTFDYVAIAPDRQIGMHSHPQWELSFVLCGGGERTIGDTTEPIAAGEIILIPPGISHQWRFSPSETDSDGNIANISVFFHSETIERLAAVAPEFAETAARLSAVTEAVRYGGDACVRVRDLLLSMRDATPLGRLPGMMELLTALTDSSDCRKVGRNNRISRADRRLEEVRIYCRCNFAREISLGEVAARVGMNKSSFCTFMRSHTGKSLTEFVNDIRLEKAREMLRDTDSPVATIAYDTGFSNVTYFNRLFKRKFRLTPGAMRSSWRGLKTP